MTVAVHWEQLQPMQFSSIQKLQADYPAMFRPFSFPSPVQGSLDLDATIWRLKLKKDKAERLNLRLRAVRNVNQLLVKEKDRARLIQGICDTLIENRDYHNAWIALLDQSGELVSSAEAGLGGRFSLIAEQLKHGVLTGCARSALAQSGVVLTEDPVLDCRDCRLSESYAGRGGMAVRLEYEGDVYGIMSLSIPKEFIKETEEHGLVEEIAGDIAFGLHTIELDQEHKQVGDALRESEKRLSQIVQVNPIPTFVINKKHVITHWNRACENLTGISSDKMIGTQNQWLAFYSEERPVLADFIVDNRKECRIAEYYEGKFRKSDVIEEGYEAEDFFPALGEKGKWLFFTAAPMKDTEGKVTGAIETLQDISEHKEIEEALQKNMQDLNKRVKELNCLFSISNLVEKQDISLEKIFQGTVDLIPPAWQYPEITCARIVLEGQEFKTENFEETIWKQAGDIIVHDVQRGILEVCYLEERPDDEEGPFIKEERDLLNAITERLGRITERKQTEHALQESERRFRDLIEHSLIGICIIQNSRIVYQNPEQERLLGPLPRPSKLTDYENIHPDDVEKIKDFYQDLSSRKVKSQETEYRFYPVDESGNRLDMKWVHCQASIIEYQGREAVLVNMMDVTRAKALENILRVQDKMSSLGRVAAGIAHEIRNPLSGINIYLNTMEKLYDRGDKPEQLKQIFRQLQSASNKIESVIRRVMDFSKPSEPNFVTIDINGPIEEAMSLSSVTLRKRGIKLEKALAEHMPQCKADPQLIEQVILNLLTNAAEAMKNVEGEKRIGVSSSLENDCIIVKVCDSGPGVPFHIKEKVFDPFYTTKNGSTGIGLSLSHRIITDHGGSLDVYPSEWGGAEFRIEIPLGRGTELR
jgi:PAS domain S-box-containing protein